MRAALLCLMLSACQAGQGFSISGGIHEILKHGVSVTLYSAPTVVKPEIHIPLAEKIGPPQW